MQTFFISLFCLTMNTRTKQNLTIDTIKEMIDDLKENMMSKMEYMVNDRDFRYRDVQLRFGSSFWFTLVGSSFQIKIKAKLHVSHY